MTNKLFLIREHLLSFTPVHFRYQDAEGIIRLRIERTAREVNFVIEVYQDDAGIILYTDSTFDNPDVMIDRALRAPIFVGGVTLASILASTKEC